MVAWDAGGVKNDTNRIRCLTKQECDFYTPSSPTILHRFGSMHICHKLPVSAFRPLKTDAACRRNVSICSYSNANCFSDIGVNNMLTKQKYTSAIGDHASSPIWF